MLINRPEMDDDGNPLFVKTHLLERAILDRLELLKDQAANRESTIEGDLVTVDEDAQVGNKRSTETSLEEPGDDNQDGAEARNAAERKDPEGEHVIRHEEQGNDDEDNVEVRIEGTTIPTRTQCTFPRKNDGESLIEKSYALRATTTPVSEANYGGNVRRGAFIATRPSTIRRYVPFRKEVHVLTTSWNYYSDVTITPKTASTDCYIDSMQSEEEDRPDVLFFGMSVKTPYRSALAAGYGLSSCDCHSPI
ncbi:unnamed protein product [Haemonchus placei]|uniref:Uncharacterized protein n=1 Tax=Haemonchus placei TaxID=6290 RepID=A0A0N4X211_HAEPC|nr:unnamed protein product [Haemonchus placei]